MILGVPNVPVLLGPFLSASQNSIGSYREMTVPNHTRTCDRAQKTLCAGCVQQPRGGWVVGGKPQWVSLPGTILPAPSAHRFSSLQLTWYTGARPSSSTLCARTMSTCFLPTPVCVCEYPGLPESRAPKWNRGMAGRPSQVVLRRSARPSSLGPDAQPLLCPGSSSPLTQ